MSTFYWPLAWPYPLSLLVQAGFLWIKSFPCSQQQQVQQINLRRYFFKIHCFHFTLVRPTNTIHPLLQANDYIKGCSILVVYASLLLDLG